MRGLDAQAGRIGERAVARLRSRVAAALREEPGGEVVETREGVAVAGRGAVRRMMAEPALRWIAGMLR